MNAKSMLDREFLEMRCRLIDLAASMDRIESGDDAAAARSDPRFQLIQGACTILADRQSGRTERMQLHFSDEYSPGWREAFALPR